MISGLAHPALGSAEVRAHCMPTVTATTTVGVHIKPLRGRSRSGAGLAPARLTGPVAPSQKKRPRRARGRR